MNTRFGSRFRQAGFSALAVLSALGLTGCTFIGYRVGQSIDRESPVSPVTRSHIELARLEPGVRVKLFLRDRDVREGLFEGLAPVSPEYAERFGAAREAQGVGTLPALGQPIELVRTGGRREQGAFSGFEPGQILVTLEGDAGPRRIALDDLARLVWTEGARSSEALTELMQSGRAPCRSRLIVGGETIPVENVDRLEVPSLRRRSAASKGAIIGAILDVAALVAVGITLGSGDYTFQGPSFADSCPSAPACDGPADQGRSWPWTTQGRRDPLHARD